MKNHTQLLIGQHLFRIAAVLLYFIMGGCADVTVRVAAETDGQTVVSQDSDTKKRSLSVDTFVKPTEKNGERPISQTCSVSMDPRKQETPGWCWAASVQMVMMAQKNHLNHLPQQCHIVDAVLDPNVIGTCCSSNIEKNACIQGGWPEWAFNEFGFEYKKVNGPEFDWETLKYQICRDKPVIYAETYVLGSGHSYVVMKVSDEFGAKMVQIYDHNPHFEEPNFKDVRFEFLSQVSPTNDLYGRNSSFFYTEISPTF